jgi:23S rRNA-/tRNA-specific pseudouridylate synthase
MTSNKITPDLGSWILHQERDWLVVNKPAGLSVHNEPGRDLISLFSRLLKATVSPVFRLDQETSGLILLSLSGEVTASWHKALEVAEKEYICLVRGNLAKTGTSVEGVWKMPLTDKAEGRKNPQGAATERKHCETHFQLVTANSYISKLRCQIRTGRQHQIRKHAVLAGHAILGDHRYGDPKYNQMIENRYGFSRLALHAHRLKCIFAGQAREWLSPAPPEFDILGLL